MATVNNSAVWLSWLPMSARALPHVSDIDLIYADASLVVANKPSGQLAVPGRGPDKQDCLSARVQARYPDALIVHRLDMATSGLMVMARGVEMQRALSKAFAARDVRKRYVAVVAGRLDAAAEGWGVIDLPIMADWPNRPMSKVDLALGKPSLTRWRVLSHADEVSTTRVELEPVTGRSHQLRLHMREIGHPILGDALYAPRAIQCQSHRLLLHAARLEFAHPLTAVPLGFQSAPPF